MYLIAHFLTFWTRIITHKELTMVGLGLSEHQLKIKSKK